MTKRLHVRMAMIVALAAGLLTGGDRALAACPPPVPAQCASSPPQEELDPAGSGRGSSGAPSAESDGIGRGSVLSSAEEELGLDGYTRPGGVHSAPEDGVEGVGRPSSVSSVPAELDLDGYIRPGGGHSASTEVRDGSLDDTADPAGYIRPGGGHSASAEELDGVGRGSGV